MSLYGKILVFLNILGAAAFVSLVSLDFGKRYAWKYANFRHDLVNYGLPLNDKETNKDGEVIVDLMGDQTRRELFTSTPVFTQVEEVKRFRQQFDGPLQAAAQDKRKQLVLYATYLRPLATTNAERERLISLLTYLSKDDSYKQLKDDLARSIRPALEIMKLDPAKRTFQEAYPEAVQRLGGDPRDPFVQALLKVLPREGKTFDQAFTAAVKAEPAGKGSLQELFLQNVRNEPGKPFADIFNGAFDEALESPRAELQRQFDAFFQEAIDGKRMVKGPDGSLKEQALSAEQQKRAIAHLLLTLVEVMPRAAAGQPAPASIFDDDASKRILTVVGLEAAGKEIDAQAKVLSNILVDLGVSRDREQTAFVLAHQDLLSHIKDRAEQVAVQDAVREKVKGLADEKQKITERRKIDIDLYEKELAAARKETTERLKELREMSKELYNIRIETRQDTEKNQAYEKEIGRLEERIR